MKKLSRFSIFSVLAISMFFASVLPARAAFVVMPEWPEQAYNFDTYVTGLPSPYKFDVFAYVEHDADPLSATFEQYRYNYWVRNVIDGTGQRWQSMEIFTVNPVIAHGSDAGTGDRGVITYLDVGQSDKLAGLPIFGVGLVPGMIEGQRTDLFWYTSLAGPGAGIGAGEGQGGNWVYGNPGTGGLPAPIPEPGTMALLGMGIVGVGFLRKARLKNSQKI